MSQTLISVSNPQVGWFLFLIGGGFLLIFALPLLFAPLRWARAFRWQVPAEAPALTAYFGRCLGGVAVVITLGMMRAAAEPRDHRALLELVAGIALFLTGVHVYGAIRRMQPWTEDAEIVLYAAVCALACWLRSGL